MCCVQIPGKDCIKQIQNGSELGMNEGGSGCFMQTVCKSPLLKSRMDNSFSLITFGVTEISDDSHRFLLNLVMVLL